MLICFNMKSYSAQWRRFRILRNVWLVALFSGLPLLWLTIKTGNRWLLGPYWIIWFTACLLTGALFSAFRCPRCGRRYLRSFDPRWIFDYLVSSSNCANCFLKKFSDHA